MGETYAGSGVDLEAGDEAVARIKETVRSTHRPEVLGDLGGFGGLFALPEGYRRPVLVGSTDGVGTKCVVARQVGRFDTLGIDLVAMCVDDLVCLGAEPLFVLDYIATGQVEPARVADLVAGVAEGCRQAGCTLLGGETAEHPGAMGPDDFDVVGSAVGVVERDRIVTGERISPGDVVLGLESPGLRSNGYSLVRRVLLERAGRSLDDPAYDGAPTTLGEELLRPSVIYAPAVVDLLGHADVRGVAHVTGGGLPGNVSRILPESTDAVIDRSTWEMPRIFSEVKHAGDVADDEMARVFNLGIGMVVVVPEPDAGQAMERLEAHGHRARAIGEIRGGDGSVTLT